MCYDGDIENRRNRMDNIDRGVTSLETALQYLSTKEDLQAVRADLRGDMMRLGLALAGLYILSIGAIVGIVQGLK